MPATRLFALSLFATFAFLAVVIPGPHRANAGSPGCIITVDSTGDDEAPNTAVTLREAIGFATDLFEPAAGEVDEVSNCPGNDDNPGAARADLIVFDQAVFPSDIETTILIGSTLRRLGTSGDTVSGVGSLVTVDGGGGDYPCFKINSSFNQVSSLRITGCAIGVDISPFVAPVGAASVPGITNNVVAGNVIVDNGYGVYIADAAFNVVSGNMIGVERDGATENGNRVGVQVGEALSDYIGRGGPLVLGAGAGAESAPANSGNVIAGNDENGIEIIGAQGTQVMGNTVGLAFDGSTAAPNGANGIFVGNAFGVQIGSPDPLDRNVISANVLDGVRIQHVMLPAGGCCAQPAGGGPIGGTTVLGNHIGTSLDGFQPRGNGNTGVFILDSSANTIGSAEPGGSNLISANQDNIRIVGEGAVQNEVKGNIIGADAGLLAPLGGEYGIFIESAPSNTIGGPGQGERNVIAGNNIGIGIIGSNAHDNQVAGNLIGELPSGEAMANGSHGIYIQNSGPNSIGGADAANGNRIAHNRGAGIAIIAAPVISSRKSILSNSIYENGGLGIDLENDGVTLNDNMDPDTGANQHQNYPVLQSAEEDSGETVIHGTLNSLPSTGFKVQLFASPACDPSGLGEGKIYLGDVIIPTTDTEGNATFDKTFATPLGGQFLTATATDPDGNTSEFSACVFVTGAVILRTWGDIDCLNGFNAVDALGTLSATTTIDVAQADQCPEIDVPIDVDGEERKWGDWNCNGEIDADDMIASLKGIAAIAEEIGNCPDIGAVVSTTLP